MLVKFTTISDYTRATLVALKYFVATPCRLIELVILNKKMWGELEGERKFDRATHYLPECKLNAKNYTKNFFMN